MCVSVCASVYVCVCDCAGPPVFAFGLCTQGPPTPPGSGNLCHVCRALLIWWGCLLSPSITHLLPPSSCASPARDRQVKVSFEPSLLGASQSFISLLFIYLTNGIICCPPPFTLPSPAPNLRIVCLSASFGPVCVCLRMSRDLIRPSVAGLACVVIFSYLFYVC